MTDNARLGFDAERAADLGALGRPDLEPARVAAVHRGCVDLLAAGGPLRGRVPGRLRHAAAAPADLPAVGDWVAVDPGSGEIAGCAVAAAVAEGRLDPRRLVQHEKLAREQAWLEQRRDGEAMRERKRRAKRMQKAYRRTQRAKGRA